MIDLNLLLFNKLREYDDVIRAKQAEESPLQDTAMRESLYHNLTDNEKIQLLRLLDKIVDSGEAESAAEAASEKPVTPFTLMAEGMTCGPDGCCF